MKKRKHKSTFSFKRKTIKPSIIVFTSLVFVLSFILILVVINHTASQKLPNYTFPKLEIYLSEVPIEQINAEPKTVKYYGNTVVLTTNNQSTTYENVEIKGRGNANWNQYKKPYQIKLDSKASILNLPESKKWILISNYLDHSYIRTDFAYYLERLLGEEYALNGNFAELFIDGTYWGLYYISEKIEIEKSHVDLKDDYSIIVELDNLHTPEEDCFYTDSYNCITTHDAINKDNSASATQAVARDISQLEIAAKKKDFEAVSNLIDIDSFAKYYLLNEFVINPDAYSSSFFFHKDGLNDKLHAGPGWDFDFSAANTLWSVDGLNREDFFSPYTNTAIKNYANSFSQDPLKSHAVSVSTIIFDLMDIPEFSQRVKEIYQSTISGKKEELLNYIGSQASYIRDAALRDTDRWKLKTDFDEEVDYLIDWISKRCDHFEETYGQNTNLEIPNTEDSSTENHITETGEPY